MPLGVNPFRPEMRRTPERVFLGPDISELPPFWTAYAGPINSGNASPVCALLYLTLLNGGRWISTRFLQKSRLASKHCWAGQKRATPEVLRPSPCNPLGRPADGAFVAQSENSQGRQWVTSFMHSMDKGGRSCDRSTRANDRSDGTNGDPANAPSTSDA